MTKQPSVQLEWLFETLEKRISQGIHLKDLFLCVPYPEEAEFDYEIEAYNKFKGNDLRRDYPNLFKQIGHDRKNSLLKVFFLKPDRLPNPVVMWAKKYAYPKVSRIHRPASLN